MLYRQIADSCFESRVGDGGASPQRVDELLSGLKPALAALQSGKNAGAAPLIAAAKRQDDLDQIRGRAAALRQRFRHIIVAGAGGSSLSGQALAALKPGAGHLRFLDTIDPDAISSLLAACPAAATHHIIISKSGETAETLAQFHLLWERVTAEMEPAKAAAHFTVITAAAASSLVTAARQFGIDILEHQAGIGGRFSVFTAVGLLPAALAGLDIGLLRQGAATVAHDLERAGDCAGFAPAAGAALQYALMEKGKLISVMFPYGDRLKGLAAWYRQSWAESLGKRGTGTTALAALGPIDQHSQLQLYLDGPKDKLFTLVLAKRRGQGAAIADAARLAPDYLRGKTAGDIMAAEQQATLETLIRHNRPVRVLEIDAPSEETLGALLMHFMLEIIFMAELLGVNPFDQPAVEESKRLAREYLLAGAA